MIKSNISICIMGLGGGGGNILDFLYTRPYPGARYIALDSDTGALARRNKMPVLQLAPGATKGLGLYSSALSGAQSAYASRKAIEEVLARTNLLVLVTALGGGTCSGAAPFIAKMAQAMGITSVAVATFPFAFEGKRRRINAEESLKILTEACQWTFVLKLSQVVATKTDESFKGVLHKIDLAIHKAAKTAILNFKDEFGASPNVGTQAF